MTTQKSSPDYEPDAKSVYKAPPAPNPDARTNRWRAVREQTGIIRAALLNGTADLTAATAALDTLDDLCGRTLKK